MANNKIVILALLLIAIIGVAKATDVAAVAPASDDDTIGIDDDGTPGAEAPGAVSSDVVAGPLGSASGATGAATDDGSSEGSESGASALQFSAIVGVAAVASYFF